MKFQLKALAAAAILAASIPAHAALDNVSSFISSLILTLLDTSNNISAAFDLGKNYANFNINTVGSGNVDSNVDAPGTTFSWNLAADGLNNGVQGDYATAWSTFFQTANINNVKFAIFANDNTTTGAGNRGIITTYAGNGTALGSSALVTLMGQADAYTNAIGAINGNVIQNHSSVLNGGSVSIAGQGYAGAYYGLNKNNGVGPFATAAIGSSLGVAQLVTGVGTGTAPQTVFAGATFSLSNTGALVYSVAAVPEADTWAMMMLGLGFMGFVARRKQA